MTYRVELKDYRDRLGDPVFLAYTENPEAEWASIERCLFDEGYKNMKYQVWAGGNKTLSVMSDEGGILMDVNMKPVKTNRSIPHELSDYLAQNS